MFSLSFSPTVVGFGNGNLNGLAIKTGAGWWGCGPPLGIIVGRDVAGYRCTDRDVDGFILQLAMLE